MDLVRFFMIFIFKIPPNWVCVVLLQRADAGGQLADILHGLHDVFLHRHNQYPPEIEWEMLFD